MYELVKAVNAYFRNITASELKSLKEKIVLSDRQAEIFERYYIKKQTTDFIADSLFTSPKVIKNELMAIRKKISPFISGT